MSASMTIERVIKPIVYVYASIPYVTLFIWFFYGVVMHNELGRWPVVYEENIQPSLEVLDAFAGMSLLIFAASVPVFILILLLSYWRSINQVNAKCILVYCIGVALFIILYVVSPLNSVVTWYLD